ncbi:MAG: hypothetical protein U1E15_06000 [Hyphomicrobiales bacterium]
MTYATLLWTAHWLGLAALTAGTVSMLHNIAVHYRARAWSAQAQREFLGASLSQLLGIMAMAYAAGGFFVRGVMSTNQLPLGHHLAAVVTLFTFATSAAIVLQVIVRPQLRDMQGAALSVSLSPNDVLAASLCLAGLSAARSLFHHAAGA